MNIYKCHLFARPLLLANYRLLHWCTYHTAPPLAFHTATYTMTSDTQLEETSEVSYPVQVYVYDLSHGLAAMYAPMILGINLEAIFHTSVVVHGKEHYIDQGIKVTDRPGSTKYGIPKEVLNMGTTGVPSELLTEFLEDLKQHEGRKYDAVLYDLFDNNCNHFSDVLCEFLVGKNLEDRILRLPQQVLATPNGQMLKGLLQQQQFGGF